MLAAWLAEARGAGEGEHRAPGNREQIKAALDRPLTPGAGAGSGRGRTWPGRRSLRSPELWRREPARATTRSGIVGPPGCAQSCGTRTFPHSAGSPATVQAVSVVLGRDDGEAGRGGPVPAQPATVSAMAAASAVHHPRLRGYPRRGAACANCLLAMVITSRRRRASCQLDRLAYRRLFDGRAAGKRAEGPVAGPAVTSLQTRPPDRPVNPCPSADPAPGPHPHRHGKKGQRGQRSRH